MSACRHFTDSLYFLWCLYGEGKLRAGQSFRYSMGLPVVGYHIGGLAEIVDDESLLAPPRDSDALDESIVCVSGRTVRVG